MAEFIETERRTVVTRAGVGDRALFFNGYRVSVWDDGKVLEIVITVAKQYECS